MTRAVRDLAADRTPGSLLGSRVRRVEDPDLLTGRGTFVANLRVDGMLHASFVRSTVAHAHLLSVDTAEASAMPGVVAVLTAADLHIAPFHGLMVVNESCARPPLATDKVRFVGEAIAVVVATDLGAAIDAAEAVVVEYDPLPAARDVRDAGADGAPLQFEELGTNVVAGMRDSRGDPLVGATRLVRAQLENQRVAVVPMEGHAIAAVPGGTTRDPDHDRFALTVYVSSQLPHIFRRQVAHLFGYDEGDVRVVAPHVGGGFGAKANLEAEHAVVIAAARKLGRPVRWIQTRSENLLAMHGRGQIQWIEMGFDDECRLRGMRCRVLGDAGAYAGFGGALPMRTTRIMAQGVYAIPRITYDVAVAVTNTAPMGAVRGAGRPEATEFLERMMDISAAELGVDPADLRGRNLIPAFEHGYATVMGPQYDNGDYRHALDEALAAADYQGLRVEQARRRQDGDQWQLGVGMAVYVEITASQLEGEEFAAVEVHTDGTATIRVGTSAHGQGHATSFAMIVADQLGIPINDIRFVQADTAAVPRGQGTGGSRSLQVGGSAVLSASQELLRKACDLAAEELEASPSDIVVLPGGVGVAGVPASTVSWAELAVLARASADEGGLVASVDYQSAGATFPFGAHVAVVEVDTETGQVRPVRHVAVDDCGRVLNPLLVTGQQHGGIAHGMAQALWEEVLFDPDGNPVTSNLAEYAMPSAAELPSFETLNPETPTFRNPLGAKGIGESGTVGAMPAAHNAVVDAVSHLGVRHIPMPCTPERVWRAIREATPERAAPPWTEPPAFFHSLPVADSGLPTTGLNI